LLFFNFTIKKDWFQNMISKLSTFVAVNNAEGKIDIRSLNLQALQEHFTHMGEKGFRARQIYDWLWKKSCVSFDEMSNISKELRNKLHENFTINNVKIHNSQFSADKTIKNSFILHDSHLIEGVLIPTPERMTACV